MAVYYGKIRLLVPSVADGKNATITSERGTSRTVEMSSPITDVMLAGMEKYTVQAGTGQSSASIGFGEMQKIVTEDASAITVASMPTKTSYLVGENLDLTGVAINATIQKGDGTSETRDVTNQCDFDPANGTQLNTEGTQRVDVEFLNLSSFFNVDVTSRILITSILPSGFGQYDEYSVVLYNKEIHVIGIHSSGVVPFHIKWNGASWVTLTPPPARTEMAVVYDGKIYGFGDTNTKDVYCYDGVSWSQSVSTIQSHDGSRFVVANDGIHQLGGHLNHDYKGHYIFDGQSWTRSVDTPIVCSGNWRGGAIFFDGKIHLLGGTSSANQTAHYSFDGTSWSSVSTLPANFGGLSLSVVYKDELYIFYATSRYKWTGSSWQSLSYPSNVFQSALSVVATDFDIYLIGSSINSYARYIAGWDNSSWRLISS